MSQKWREVKRWDDEHLTGPLRPLWYLLRTFSAITFAVILLSLVMLYGILASIPIGLLALAPTYLLYAATVVAPVVLLSALAWRLMSRATARAGRGMRFVACAGATVVVAGLAVVAWAQWAWPALKYDPGTQSGVRLFAEFVEAHKAESVRRLPMLEMSELEFYSWWPLRLILLLFVFNLVIATVRRIEFKFVNIGVLTVHSGIVLIALGSVYYAGLKLEGDTLLSAGPVDRQTGRPTIGPPQRAFYDNTDVALWLNQGRGWTQRPLSGVPRYNDYNVGAGADGSVRERLGRFEPAPSLGALDIPAPAPAGSAVIDPDIKLRIVGYASYAEPLRDWVPAPGYRRPPGGDSGDDRVQPSDADAGPLRFVEVRIAGAAAGAPGGADQTFPFFVLPEQPAARAADTPVLVIEHTIGMPDARWEALRQPLPRPGAWGLVIDVPGAGVREVHTVAEGDTLAIGETGYAVEVRQLLPEPPFPIITPGYEGATSSIAILGVTTPEGETYERWVYSRFPEISQDMLGGQQADGRSARRAADPAIGIHLIDASRRHVVIDELPAPDGADRADGAPGPARALVRAPGGAVTEHADLAPDGAIDALAGVRIARAGGWPAAAEIRRPMPVPEDERENDRIGTHESALLAVEVTVEGHPGFQRIIWIPFRRYVLEMSTGDEPSVTLPDGRTLRLVFGRVQHRLPGFEVRLVDFEMIAYDHRGAPRDYQSALRVSPAPGWDGTAPAFEPYTHVAKLNAPLQAPFMWSEQRSWLDNMTGYIRARLDPAQFKFSQAGWDAEGWRQTQALADQGEIPSPYASFTILQVGNNPGIHVIALGGILMGVGIPWAFYIKPWILQRRKRKLQEQIARARAGAGATESRTTTSTAALDAAGARS